MFAFWRRKKSANRPIPWGGVEFDDEELAPHYAVMGMTSSGKTLIIRMLMKAVLCPDGSGLRCRAVVYDPKRDFYPLLVGMGVKPAQIRVMHPFDARSVAWDIAADVRDPAASRQVAEILSPPEKQNVQPFFVNASIDLVAAVMNSLRVLRPDNWTLNDVVEAATAPDRLRAILAVTPDGRDVERVYFGGSPETGANVVSTIRTKLASYATAARLSARAKEKVSLAAWARSLEPEVLLLGTDDTNAATLDPLNRAIFLRASQLVTGRIDENPPDESWFFVDEARWAGRLEGLSGLLLKGRSKGAHVVLGFQDILGLREAYDGMVADELVGQCGNLAVLKLNSPETMTWAARYFGNYEEYVPSYGSSSGGESGTSSVNYNFTTRQAILEQEFRDMPLPKIGRGIRGAFASPDRTWQDTIPPRFVERYLVSASNDSGFVARDAGDQDPLPWGVDFLEALKKAGESRVSPNGVTSAAALRTLPMHRRR